MENNSNHMFTQNDIGTIGFDVIATTTFKHGVSYDAHFVNGKRLMVRGSVEDTPEQAMNALYLACLERN